MVAQGLWQTVRAGRAAEAALEVAARRLRVDRDRLRERAWCRGGRSRRARTSVDRAVVVDLVAHGLAERVLEVVLRAARGEVQQGLGDRRDRDALVAGGVLGIEGA